VSQLVKKVYELVSENKLEEFKKLYESNKKVVELKTPFGYPLHIAASNGYLKFVKFLVKSGADINKRGGTFDAAPIKYASSGNFEDIVEYFLSLDCNLDVSEPEKNPLFGAAHFGHLAIVKLLINAGIDYKVKYTGKSMKNMDAIAFATEMGQTKVAKYLKSLK